MMPIITRLYGPDSFGIFAIYLSLTTLGFMASTLRFNAAQMLPRKNTDASNLFALSVTCVFIVSLLVLVAICAVLAVSDEGGTVSAQSYWLLLIPLGILIQGTHQTLVLWVLRQRGFHRLAVARISEAVGDRATSLAHGFLIGSGPLGLMAGRILGPLTALVVLFASTRNRTGWGLRTGCWSRPRVWALAKRYRRFATHSTPAMFINVAAREAPSVLLAVLFSPIITGLYALSAKILQGPMLVVGDALAKAMLQHSIERRDDSQQLADSVSLVVRLSLYIMVPPMLLVVCFGESIFGFVFGPSWERAGGFARILALLFVGGFLDRALGVLFDAFERQTERLQFDVALLTARTLGLCLGAWLFATPEAALSLMVAATCVVYARACAFQFRLVGQPVSSLLSSLGQALRVLLPSIFGIVAVSAYPGLSTTSTISLTTLILLLQTWAIFALEPALREGVAGVIGGPIRPRRARSVQ